MTILKRFVLLALLANLGLCGGAFAGPAWLCSIVSAVAADEDGTVGPPDLGGLERPTFFRVDSGKKEVTLLAPSSRRGEVTKIESVRETDGQWMFAGVENGRAWSVIITEKGNVTLSVVSDGSVWAVFGCAIPEREDAGGKPKEAK
jgi:hypothetical protein